MTRPFVMENKFQAASFLHQKKKIEIAKALEALGVDVIEAGFPISSPGDFQSVVELSKAVREPIICALTRANRKDIDSAVAALQFATPKNTYRDRIF
ncbi:hypothetical protein [Pedobacter sp. NJ-S-72]